MNKQKSFTLIELLIVIVIIGILAGVIMISTSSSIDKANFAKAQAFSKTVQNELLLNLVSEWTFDEPEVLGKTKDSWGNNHGTLMGTPQYYNSSSGNCVFGGCYSFNGSSNYINIDFPNELIGFTTQDFTISFWMNAKTFSGQSTYKRIIDITETISPANNFQFAGSSADGQLQFYGHKETVIYRKATNPSAISLNKWIYIIGIWKTNNNTPYLYLNTVQQNNSGSGTPTATLNNSFNIGRRADGELTSYFDGSLDDLRIYNAALSLSQIKQNYISGLDSLLSQKSISKEDYNQRINELAYE